MFVALAGIDGAGKTTVASHAARLLEADGTQVRLLHKQDAHLVAPDRFRGLITRHAEALWRNHDAVSGEAGDEYWWLMQMSWFALMSATVLVAGDASGEVVLTDDWTHKITARYTLKESFDPRLMAASLSVVRRPDLVILLDTPAEVAAQRKAADIGFAESGGSDGLSSGRLSSFTTYQSRVRCVLQDVATEREWPTILTSDRPASDVAAEVAALIARHATANHPLPFHARDE
jgi:thymidylate kinase